MLLSIRATLQVQRRQRARPFELRASERSRKRTRWCAACVDQFAPEPKKQGFNGRKLVPT